MSDGGACVAITAFAYVIGWAAGYWACWRRFNGTDRCATRVNKDRDR